ncbi:MAG TPA: helix-turn-helix domain-containing protein [Candidatus Acidoferrales bacterium]|nr:helix-turn-helix domain-containing protein [Candidatus Acidoferrales bacterium]
MGVLVGLGLSGRQARVYLALLRAGDAKAKGLAELAQVERQEVYGLVEALRELGLVEVNLTVPTSYTPTPIAEGIKLLIEQKTDELTSISIKAQQLSTKLNTQTLAASAAPSQCFGSICDGYRGKKYLKAIQETQHTIDAVTSWTRFKQQSFRFENHFKAALKKGIVLCFVIEKPLNHQLPKWVKTTQEKYPNLSIKTQSNPVSASVAIFDQNKAAIAFNTNASLSKGPDLWTTNPALTAICQAYFDTVWKQTKK